MEVIIKVIGNGSLSLSSNKICITFRQKVAWATRVFHKGF